MSKNVIVLWSGGLDSTFLVQQCLNRKYNTTAIYVKIENNSAKAACELEQIEKLKELFANKQYLKLKTESVKIEINEYHRQLYFSQLFPWIISLLYCIEADTDEVYIGYCMNDDMISFLPELKALLKSCKKFLKNKKVKFKFPLRKLNKEVMSSSLSPEIFQQVTWCELGSGQASTCRCISCQKARMFGLVNQYETRNEKVTENNSQATVDLLSQEEEEDSYRVT